MNALRSQVQVNPFDDIVPRETISQELEDKAEKKKKKSKAKAHKAFNVLSFGAEAEKEEEDLVQAIGADKGKSKSAHDLAKDPKLGGLDQHQARDQLGIADESSSDEEDEDAEELKRQQAQVRVLSKSFTILPSGKVGLREEQVGEEEGRKGVDGHQNQGQEN